MLNFPKTLSAFMDGPKAAAEAILEEIPAGDRGHSSDADKRLSEMATELENNGIEKSKATLKVYREVAMWVQSNTAETQYFGWLDASFTVHKEAYAAGWSFAELRKQVERHANPNHRCETGRKGAHRLRANDVRRKNGETLKDAHGLTYDEKIEKAAGYISTAFTAWDNGDWEPDDNSKFFLHFLAKLINERSVSPVVVDNLVDDIYSFMESLKDS